MPLSLAIPRALELLSRSDAPAAAHVAACVASRRIGSRRRAARDENEACVGLLLSARGDLDHAAAALRPLGEGTDGDRSGGARASCGSGRASRPSEQKSLACTKRSWRLTWTTPGSVSDGSVCGRLRVRAQPGRRCSRPRQRVSRRGGSSWFGNWGEAGLELGVSPRATGRIARDVALKILLHPASRTDRIVRLRAEVHVAAALASRHVVRVYDLIENLGALSMEYCAGGTLRSAISRSATPVDVRRRWAVGIAHAFMSRGAWARLGASGPQAGQRDVSRGRRAGAQRLPVSHAGGARVWRAPFFEGTAGFVAPEVQQRKIADPRVGRVCLWSLAARAAGQRGCSARAPDVRCACLGPGPPPSRRFGVARSARRPGACSVMTAREAARRGVTLAADVAFVLGVLVALVDALHVRVMAHPRLVTCGVLVAVGSFGYAPVFMCIPFALGPAAQALGARRARTPGLRARRSGAARGCHRVRATVRLVSRGPRRGDRAGGARSSKRAPGAPCWRPYASGGSCGRDGREPVHLAREPRHPRVGWWRGGIFLVSDAGFWVAHRDVYALPRFHLFAPTPVAPRPLRTRPNLILLLTVDALRYDATRAPVFRSFAAVHEHAVTFTHARAPAAWTVPSIYGLMTGRGPWSVDWTLGRFFGDRPVPYVGTDRDARRVWPLPMDDPSTTLAEALHAAGYQTRTCASLPFFLEGTGVSRGFDVVDGGVYKQRNRNLRGTTSDLLTACGIAMIDAAQGAPLFLWLHYSDPHEPYEPHPGLHRGRRERRAAVCR